MAGIAETFSFGMTGFRAFLAGTSSQPLNLMNGPHNLPHLDPQVPGREETYHTLFLLNFLP